MMNLNKIKSNINKITKHIGYYSNKKINVNPKWDFKYINLPRKFSFGGYYDVDLLFEEKMLFHSYNFTENNKIHPKFFDIILYDFHKKTYLELGKSKACNWQIGSRLQWTNKKHIFFNDVKKGKIYSKLKQKNGKTLHEFNNPFWLFCEKKNLGVTISFSNLCKKRPGYGYLGTHEGIKKNEIKFFDLNNEKPFFIYNNSEHTKQNDTYYFNHVIANEDKTIFLTTLNNNTTKLREVIPIVIKPYIGKVTVIKRYGIFSHPSFISKNEILFYCEKGYVKLNLENEQEDIFLKTIKDGHPSLKQYNNSNYFIADSYPNRFSKFFCYELTETNSKKVIVSLFNPPFYEGDLRCDLHPRLHNQNEIIIDTPHLNGRKLMYLKRNL